MGLGVIGLLNHQKYLSWLVIITGHLVLQLGMVPRVSFIPFDGRDMSEHIRAQLIVGNCEIQVLLL